MIELKDSMASDLFDFLLYFEVGVDDGESLTFLTEIMTQHGLLESHLTKTKNLYC